MNTFKVVVILAILLLNSHAVNSTYSVEFVGWFSKGNPVEMVPPLGEKLSAVARIIAASVISGVVVASILAEDSEGRTNALVSQEYNLDLAAGQDVIIILDLVVSASLLVSPVDLFMRLEGAVAWEMPRTCPPRLPLQITTVTTTATNITTSSMTPTLTLSPTSGSVGTVVSVSGPNYAGTSCVLTATPPILFTSQECSITAGMLTGNFTVASGAAAGSYVVTVQTNAGAGDSATALFSVGGAGPTTTLVLSPTSGPVGTSVAVSGSNYAGTSCTLSSSPSGLFTTSTCSISGGALSGSFTVASSATSGTYTVTTSAGTASAAFTVPARTLVLSPTSGRAGTAVTASGLNYAGTSCTLSSSPSGLLSSPTCSISAGTLTGGFTVTSGIALGGYMVTVATNVVGETASATFTVTALTTATSATTTTTGFRCVIATATFGSEVSPAVQYLRNFRDHLVLETRAGSAFMDVFNAWYYSFSPSLAAVIAGNDALRTLLRPILYPLLGTLGISALAYSLFRWAPEFAVVISGIVASSLIGLIYLTAPAILGVYAIVRRRIKITMAGKCLLILVALALAVLTAGEIAGSFLLLAIGSAAVVLTCVIAVPTIVALAFVRSALPYSH